MKGLIWLIKACVAGLISLTVLSVFLLLYGYTGVHITSTTGATDYTWEPYQIKTTMTEGFAWFQMDQNGFNNVNKCVSTTDVLLMGSSHMEAVNVAKNKNVGALLNEALDDNVYNIGVSGHQIYHCVNNIDNAIDTYQPTQWVIIETDRVQLDILEMQSVIDGKYEYIESYDEGTIYYVQKYFPSVKTILKNISDWRNLDNTENDFASNDDISDEYDDCLTSFLKKAVNSLDGQKLMIFYQPATEIDSNGELVLNKDEQYLEIFKTKCEGLGIVFVDMTDDFYELYTDKNILAHGFVNTGVGTGHLNEYGHQVIADRVIKELKVQRERNE